MSTDRIIRKTSYGRTLLFLPSVTGIIREVKCMGGMKRYDCACVYHMLPQTHGKGTACWHCCEEIHDTDTIVPLPKIYDTTERTFHVYGATCSPSCAKGYILEHTTFDRGHHLNVLVKMLREVYGVHENVIASPPRSAMLRFGGMFDPRGNKKVKCAVVQPPFVSYCMIAEERVDANTVQSTAVSTPVPMDVVPSTADEADTLDEPSPPALYEGFLESVQESTHHDPRTEAKPAASKRSKQAQLPDAPMAQARGPMAKFMKKSS